MTPFFDVFLVIDNSVCCISDSRQPCLLNLHSETNLKVAANAAERTAAAVQSAFTAIIAVVARPNQCPQK